MIKNKIAHTGIGRTFADVLSTKIFGIPCEPFEYESYGYGDRYHTLELKRQFHFKRIVFNGVVKPTPEELKILQKYEVEVVYCGY